MRCANCKQTLDINKDAIKINALNEPVHHPKCPHEYLPEESLTTSTLPFVYKEGVNVFGLNKKPFSDISGSNPMYKTPEEYMPGKPKSGQILSDETMFGVKAYVDMVNHPSHYTQGKVECIDALEAATMNLKGIEAVCTANAIKYLWRWKDKGGAEDLKKAIRYIEIIMEKAPAD